MHNSIWLVRRKKSNHIWTNSQETISIIGVRTHRIKDFHLWSQKLESQTLFQFTEWFFLLQNDKDTSSSGIFLLTYTEKLYLKSALRWRDLKYNISKYNRTSFYKMMGLYVNNASFLPTWCYLLTMTWWSIWLILKSIKIPVYQNLIYVQST